MCVSVFASLQISLLIEILGKIAVAVKICHVQIEIFMNTFFYIKYNFVSKNENAMTLWD